MPDNAGMAEYSHAVWDVKYHVIWVTKYRYKVVRGEVALRTRRSVTANLSRKGNVIVQGAVSPDHVHMLVSVPPQLAPAKLVQYMKGRSSRMLQEEFPQLKKRYWGQHLWGAGLFLCERRRGRRRHHQAVHRESAVEGPRSELQDHSAERALSRL